MPRVMPFLLAGLALQLVQGDWEIAHALSRRVVDRVCDCRRNADDTDLAQRDEKSV
jgi:hypothetical protein